MTLLAQAVHLTHAGERHPAVVEAVVALELRLDDAAQLLVLDAVRVFLLDAHAATHGRQAVEEMAQIAIPRRRPPVEVDRRRQHDEPALAVLLLLGHLDCQQRSHAHAHDVQGLELGSQLAIARAAGVEPVLDRHPQQVLGAGAVSRQRERVRDEPRHLEALVHRAQVVLRPPRP